MVSQVERMTALPTADDAQAAAFTKEELERMFEFDRIVKFRDTITSGKHPRIKVPQNLLPANTNATAPSSRPLASRSSTAPDASAVQPTSSSSNGSSSSRSSQQLAGRALPGLGRSPIAGGGTGGGASTSAGNKEKEAEVEDKEKEKDPVRAKFLAKRAELERALLEQGKSQAGKDHPLFKDPLPDFDINSVWKQGLARARTFAPTNGTRSQDKAASAATVTAAVTTTVAASASASAATAAAATAAPASDDKGDSADDKTFYSSNFSTPEFGLTARIPVESDNDDVSMQDSSDYEPELDSVPSPALHAQPLSANRPDQPQPQPQPQPQAQVQTEQSGSRSGPTGPAGPAGPAEPAGSARSAGPGYPVPSFPYQGNAAPPPPAGLPQHWDLAARLLQSGDFPPTEGGQRNAGAEAPRPPSPFVRAHDLSPVAPQPTHTTAVTVEQLSTAAQNQSGVPDSRAAPAQVAVLRRQQAAAGSSPDSSPQTTESRGRTAGSRGTERRRGKKKNNKRKAEQAMAASPRVKEEPRSPSPIVAPPAQRGNKRQRQSSRQIQEAQPVQVGEFGRVIRENPPVQPNPPQPFRDGRVSVVYEQRPPRREWDGYESRPPPPPPPHYAPAMHTPSAPPTTHYGPRSVRSASHTLVEAPSGYARSARSGYGGVYEPARMSVRPEGLIHERSGSPTMPPPPSSSSRMPYQHSLPDHPHSPTTHIVVDEFGREYYEPPRPAIRQSAMDMAPRGPRYDSEMVYERLAAPPLQSQPPPPPPPGMQIPLGYEAERAALYQRPSPTYVQPRRVVTQPEYAAAYDSIGGRQREYSALPAGLRPGEEYGAPPPPPPAPPREYLVRASTARPPEPMQYEVAPPGAYMERVGSVRPPEAVPMGHEFGGGGGGGGSGGYDNRYREPPVAGPYMGGGGYDAAGREYSMRPEPAAMVPLPYSVRPETVPFYVDQPAGGPFAGYGYPESGRRDVYR